jgi:uncharacterized protein YndB with AHSA1/START domain
MSPTPTGRLESHGNRHTLVMTRDFKAPIDDVWASVTEPERLERWIGTFSGDPEDGYVMFRMTFEGDDHEPEKMEIRECDPPRRLALTSQVGEQVWFLELDLAEADGVTTVTFSQPDIDPAAIENVGPGWEYYLDNLVAAREGRPLPAFTDYYPSQKAWYQAQVAALGAGGAGG